MAAWEHFITTPKTRRAGGRPRHEPSSFQRGQVSGLASVGIAHADISRVIGVDAKTLRKHYGTELDSAAIIANGLVGHSLFQMAVGGPNRDWRRAVPSAAIFWAKTRMGWREPAQKADPDEIGAVVDAKASLLLKLNKMAERRNNLVQSNGASVIPAYKKGF